MDSIPILDIVLRIFQGLLMPVIAGIAVYIAFQQHKTNRDKLRLDLYNKRYELFHSLMTLLARILQQGNVKDEQVTEFSRATKEAVFLFDEGLSTYLETIRKKALDLWAAEEGMKPLPVGKERSAKVAEVRELYDWFTKQFEVAIDKFNKYLKFKQKLEGKDMNWKRGFRRITLVLAIVVGLLSAFCAVTIVTTEYKTRQQVLQNTRFDYLNKYGIETIEKKYGLKFLPDEPTKAEVDAYKTELEKRRMELKNKRTLSSQELLELWPDTEELLDLEKGFWVNLSTAGFVGLCVSIGLGAAVVGYCGIWLIYYFVEWLIRGFADDK